LYTFVRNLEHHMILASAQERTNNYLIPQQGILSLQFHLDANINLMRRSKLITL